MMSVGDTLRRERIRRNLQLDQISSELKISSRFLEAIEDERFEKLPGGVFAKAFVRQYGRLLGLNEQELASQLDQILEPIPVEPIEQIHATRTGLAPIQVPRLEEWQSVGDHRMKFGGSLSAAIVVVVVMLVCSGVYAWLQRQHNPVSAHNSPPASTPVKTQTAPPKTEPAQSATAPATQQPPSPASSTPAQQPSSPAAANTPTAQPPVTKAEVGTPPPPQSAPNPAATVRIEIIASEPVWVLARTDGKFAFTGTMDTNTRRSVDAVKDIVLRLGNAGGVTILLNGQPIPPVGPKGQARTVQFTSGGFQIVPAKPPSESPAPIARL